MLISPPFLPLRADNATYDEWLDTAMPADPQGHGKYPVSFNLGWHGGVHLQAPQGNDGHRLPVRAIADGIVVYMREPETPDNSPQHALNYGDVEGNPVWTSNGCVVVRHTTEIGADLAGQTTAVTFFSVYMHLHTIRSTVQPNRQIYRKDEIGDAGYIYGEPNLLHFEIICDDTNLQMLVGRAAGDVPTGRNGRSDAVYGTVHFHLPAGTSIYAQQPAAHIVQPAIQPAYTTTEELFVALCYAGGNGPAGNRGDAYLQTCRPDGAVIGNALEENDAEYVLHTEANRIVTAYRNAHEPQVPSPSAVYELLRYGRTIGPDVLTPANTPHWRQIRYDGGQGWVNLNAANVHQFSDADFPHWAGWTLIDDSVDQDSRCDSIAIRSLLDPNNDGQVAPQEAGSRLQESTVQEKLSRIIARFPTEWEAASIDRRWGWLKTSTPENPEPLADEDFDRLKAHLEALCFWERANLGIPTTHWHFHPKEFIRHFKRCGWLSLDELAQTLPRYMFYNTSANPVTAITSGTPAIYQITRNEARLRLSHHAVSLNKTMSKYVIEGEKRKSHFLSQVTLETAQWRNIPPNRLLMHEWFFGQYSAANPMTQYYAAFYGRGIMQLTWVGNYKAYGDYRGNVSLPNHTGPYTERLTPNSPRITAASLHWTASPENGGSQTQWAPRFDPDVIASDPYNACDSGGYYWVSKAHNGHSNINRVCDLPFDTNAVHRINVLVNGGFNGYYERQAYASYLFRFFSDSIETSIQQQINPPHPKRSVQVNFSKPL